MKDSIETLKRKVLDHAINNGFYLNGYAGCTVEGLSWLPDYNRENNPPVTDLKQITEVLKEAGLIRWDNAVQGWFIPHNVDDRLDHLREAA